MCSLCMTTHRTNCTTPACVEIFPGASLKDVGKFDAFLRLTTVNSTVVVVEVTGPFRASVLLRVQGLAETCRRSLLIKVHQPALEVPVFNFSVW
jgi:hypothetical protein